MSAWRVEIPGIAEPFRAVNCDAREALVAALDHHGMHFAPPGTTVTPAAGAVPAMRVYEGCFDRDTSFLPHLEKSADAGEA